MSALASWRLQQMTRSWMGDTKLLQLLVCFAADLKLRAEQMGCTALTAHADGQLMVLCLCHFFFGLNFREMGFQWEEQHPSAKPLL